MMGSLRDSARQLLLVYHPVMALFFAGCAYPTQARVERLLQEPERRYVATARSQGEIVADLVELGRPAVPAMVQALPGNSRASVRAAMALGRIGDLRARDPLVETMEHAPPPPNASQGFSELQANLFLAYESSLALCRLDDPRGVRTLVEWIAFAVDQGMSSRRAGLLFPHPNPTLFSLCEGRIDIDESWDAVVNMKGTAVPPLVGCAREPKGSTAPFVAIALLGAIKEPEAVEPLLEMLSNADVQRSAALIRALGLIGDARAIGPLAAAWTPTAAWEVKCALAEALPRLGPSAIPVTIGRIRQEPEYGIRQLGLRELARTNDPRVIDELLWLIDSDRPHDPVFAARALIYTSGPKAVAGLKRALSHEDFGVRNDAAKALAKLAGADAVQALIVLLKDRDAMVRETIVQELGNLRAAEAVHGLSILTHDENWSVRRSAVWALGKIGAKEGLPFIQERLDDPHPRVRDAAAEAFREVSKRPADGPSTNPTQN